jgi:hypothetical protein
MAIEMKDAWTDERLDDLNTKVDRGFESVDRRFEAVDRRFDAVDKRFDRVETRIERLDDKFDALNRTLLSGFFVLIASMVGLAIGFH